MRDLDWSQVSSRSVKSVSLNIVYACQNSAANFIAGAQGLRETKRRKVVLRYIHDY